MVVQYDYFPIEYTLKDPCSSTFLYTPKRRTYEKIKKKYYNSVRNSQILKSTNFVPILSLLTWEANEQKPRRNCLYGDQNVFKSYLTVGLTSCNETEFYFFRCSMHQNCSIFASTNMFGDPCPNTLKYLEAHYQCVPGKVLILNLITLFTNVI